ncbi:hypothetical protein ACFQI7_28195 [Paenibacillus allorhizosphaerae]|uniref:Nuclear transport factor 2 family protein n=1 Tax=Paenibacillus allorhizosphaerae TaxID=2849866 RepID=A0ABM8VNI1_9BACL|nr:hypothetical protein [Paenibacillus allorhizosphaerae]CAG7651457.1 hypothetical protein PAECIP111802_04969 [Paenibacillus allorhizosphaerae]
MSEDNIRYDQVKIICAEDCGNAPKKELLRAFNVAFVCNDIGLITETIIEDIQWNFIGNNVLQGKAQVFKMLEELIDNKPTELVISNIVTHGYSGSLNGILNLESNISYAFCNIYRFNSSLNKTKIKEITSYIIDISK